jgi:hypothetical protein
VGKPVGTCSGSNVQKYILAKSPKCGSSRGVGGGGDGDIGPLLDKSKGDEVFAGSDLSQVQNSSEKIPHNHDHPHLDN